MNFFKNLFNSPAKATFFFLIGAGTSSYYFHQYRIRTQFIPEQVKYSIFLLENNLNFSKNIGTQFKIASIIRKSTLKDISNVLYEFKVKGPEGRIKVEVEAEGFSHHELKLISQNKLAILNQITQQYQEKHPLSSTLSLQNSEEFRNKLLNHPDFIPLNLNNFFIISSGSFINQNKKVDNDELVWRIKAINGTIARDKKMIEFTDPIEEKLFSYYLFETYKDLLAKYEEKKLFTELEFQKNLSTNETFYEQFDLVRRKQGWIILGIVIFTIVVFFFRNSIKPVQIQYSEPARSALRYVCMNETAKGLLGSQIQIKQSKGYMLPFYSNIKISLNLQGNKSEGSITALLNKNRKTMVWEIEKIVLNNEGTTYNI